MNGLRGPKRSVVNGLVAARRSALRDETQAAPRAEVKFQKKKRWADHEVMWGEIVICAEDVDRLVEFGVPGDAAIAYWDRGTYRALRDEGLTKDEITEAWIAMERARLHDLPALPAEQG